MSAHASLYKSKAWYRLRHHQLTQQPLCAYCKQLGRTVAATVVDHIKPHRGDLELFYNPTNLQSLCDQCHNRHKQRQEKSGYLAGGDADGIPVDPLHHWNR